VFTQTFNGQIPSLLYYVNKSWRVWMIDIDTKLIIINWCVVWQCAVSVYMAT